jgi:hypothetical protein
MATVDDVLRTARAEIGTTESPFGSNRQKYGVAYGMNGVAWCSIFAWWCFNANGINLKRVVSGGYSDCDTALAGYARNGWVLGDKRMARPGDVVFYDMSNSDGRGADHTGIVEAVSPGGVTAIEGNTSAVGSQTNGGAVLRKMRSWSQIKAVCRVPLSATTTPTPPVATPPEQAPPIIPIPTTEDDDMRIFKVHGGQHWFCGFGDQGGVRQPISEDHANKLRFSGIPYAVIADQAASMVILDRFNEVPA